MHQEAVIKLAATNTSPGIDVQLSTQLESEQKYHRHMLMKLLRTIKFLEDKDCLFVATERILRPLQMGTFSSYCCSKPKIAQNWTLGLEERNTFLLILLMKLS